MKIEQLPGWDESTSDGYTGPARSVTVDITNWDLRLHDGVTPGGWAMRPGSLAVMYVRSLTAALTVDDSDPTEPKLTIDVAALATQVGTELALDSKLAEKSDKLREVITNTTSSLTLSDAHIGNVVRQANGSGDGIVGIPLQADEAWPDGTQIDVLRVGAGTARIRPAAGVTLNGGSADIVIPARYTGGMLLRIALNTWEYYGNGVAQI